MLQGKLETLVERAERWRWLEQQITDDRAAEALHLEVARLEEKIAYLHVANAEPWST